MSGNAGGLLSLKWNNHQSTFLHVLSSLCLNDTLSDVTLACEGEFYAAHKIVLATCSEYFEKIFEKIEGKHSVIVLSHVKCEELEALLSYMYEGEINVLQEKLSGLIQAAEYLKIKGLSDSDDAPDLFSTRISKRARRRSRPSQKDSSQSPPSKRKRNESEDSLPPLQIDSTAHQDSQDGNRPGTPVTKCVRGFGNASSNGDIQKHDADIIKEEVEMGFKNDLMAVASEALRFTNEEEYESRLPFSGNAEGTNIGPFTGLERNMSTYTGLEEGNSVSNSFWETSSDISGFNNSTVMNSSGIESGPVNRRSSEHLTVTPVADLVPVSRSQDEGSFACPYCPFRTYQTVAYEAHVRRHANEKNFSCQFCSYTTTTKSNLKCHIRKHTGEKPFGCPHCDYRSAQSSNIKIHVRRMHKGALSEDVPKPENSADDLVQ